MKLLLNLSITVWNVQCKDRFSLKNHIFKIIHNSPRLPLMILVCPHFALSLSSVLPLLKSRWDFFVWWEEGTNWFNGDIVELQKSNVFIFGVLEGLTGPGVHFTDKWPHVVEVKTVNTTKTEGAAAEELIPLFWNSLLVFPGQDEWARSWTFYWAND